MHERAESLILSEKPPLGSDKTLDRSLSHIRFEGRARVTIPKREFGYGLQGREKPAHGSIDGITDDSGVLIPRIQSFAEERDMSADNRILTTELLNEIAMAAG